MQHLCLLFIACVATATASSTPTVPLFMWSTDSHFKSPNTYVLPTLGLGEALRQVAANLVTNQPSQPADAIGMQRAVTQPEVVVAYVADALRTDETPETLQELEATFKGAASSVVAPYALPATSPTSLLSALAAFVAGEPAGQVRVAADAAGDAHITLAAAVADDRWVSTELPSVGQAAWLEDGRTDILLVPVTAKSVIQTVLGMETFLQGHSVVSVLTAATAPELPQLPMAQRNSTTHHHSTSRQLLMTNTAARHLTLSADSAWGGCKKLSDRMPDGSLCPTSMFITGSPGLCAGMIFFFMWLIAVCLGANAMMDISTPTQYWLEANLPLKGKVDE